MNSTEIEQYISDYLLNRSQYYLDDNLASDFVNSLENLMRDSQSHETLRRSVSTSDFLLSVIIIKSHLNQGEIEKSKELFNSWAHYLARKKNHKRYKQLYSFFENERNLFSANEHFIKNTVHDFVENPKYYISDENDFLRYFSYCSLVDEYDFVKSFVEVSPRFRLTRKIFKEITMLAISGGSNLLLELVIYIDKNSEEFKLSASDKMYVSKYNIKIKQEEILETKKKESQKSVLSARERSELVDNIHDLKDILNKQSVTKKEVLNCYYELSDCYRQLGKDSVAYILLKQVQIEDVNFRRVRERMKYFE